MQLNGVCTFYSETGTEGGFWALQDAKFMTLERWSYEGLHILKDGDKLTIYSKANPSVVVWAGEIALIEYPPFTEEVGGWWIHADQRGVERGEWFTFFGENYPAVLERE